MGNENSFAAVSAHEDDARIRQNRIGTAGIIAGVLLLVSSWFLIPNGIIAATEADRTLDAFLLLAAGTVALATGVVLLTVGVRIRRDVRRGLHTPSSADGKANPRYQEDQKPLATPGVPVGWTGLTPGGR